MPASQPQPDPEEEGQRLHPKYLKSEELGRKITECCAWLNAGEYQWLTMVREFDTRRELSYFYDDDGSFNFRGRFTAEQGELILKALELAMEQGDQEVTKERDHLRAAAEKAEADVSAEMPAEPLATDNAARYYDSDPSEETRPLNPAPPVAPMP